jgi:putative DNA primase/helicase
MSEKNFTPDPLGITEQELARQVEERAAGLLPQVVREPLDPLFVKSCLDGNERGDGCMTAALLKDRFLLNVTVNKDPEWYSWKGNVWQRDVYRESIDAVEECAIEYSRMAIDLSNKIEELGVTKKDKDNGWMVALRDKYLTRVSRLRSENGIKKALAMSAVVDRKTMACEESEFNKNPWLLPVQNGVIDLESGALTKGRPSDRMTKTLDIEYDPRAEYGPWVDFVQEVSDSVEMEQFQKRSLGYAATGFSHEQYIWFYIGPGRNGKGIFFNAISDVLGPYYHEIDKAMILEQRNEPGPNAASEHKYSLLHKRFIVAAETNKGQKIDPSALKTLTGMNNIRCRPNFRSEIIFSPSHSTFCQTNSFPIGLTRELSLIERMLIVEFPFIYVDDVDEKKRKFPALADKFRKKDPKLHEKLAKYRQGVLRWIVEGAKDWNENGLQPPQQVFDHVNRLVKENDPVGLFIEDCCDQWPDRPEIRMTTKTMYEVFKFWWKQNNEDNDKYIPSIKGITATLREKGFVVKPSGGSTWIERLSIKLSVDLNMRGES